MRKSTPPLMSMVLSEILVASSFPPSTATPVQSACPMMPPVVTPNASFCAASAIVAIWERSPHSARNVMVKHWMNTLEKNRRKKREHVAITRRGEGHARGRTARKHLDAATVGRFQLLLLQLLLDLVQLLLEVARAVHLVGVVQQLGAEEEEQQRREVVRQLRVQDGRKGLTHCGREDGH